MNTTTPSKPAFKKKVSTKPVQFFELDDTAVAELSVPAVKVLVNNNKINMFICEHCGKQFNSDRAYFRHTCDGKLRSDFIKTETGQHAFDIYHKWMLNEHSNMKGSTVEHFKSSSYFYTFKAIAEYLENVVKVIDEECFIRTAVRFKMVPTLWINHNGLVEQYKKDLVSIPTHKQMSVSYNALNPIADKNGYSVDEYIETLHPNDIYSMLKNCEVCPEYVLRTPVLSALLKHLERDELAEVYEIVRLSRFTQPLNVQVVDSIVEIKALAGTTELSGYLQALRPYDVLDMVKQGVIRPAYALLSPILKKKVAQLSQEAQQEFMQMFDVNAYKEMVSIKSDKDKALSLINYKEGEF